jgi:hypothetical protein
MDINVQYVLVLSYWMGRHANGCDACVFLRMFDYLLLIKMDILYI